MNRASALARLRCAANMTQHELALQASQSGAHFSASEISAAEGRRRNLSVKKLRLLAPFLTPKPILTEDEKRAIVAEIALDQALAEIEARTGGVAVQTALRSLLGPTT